MLTPQETAEMLSVTLGQLKAMRARGRGPTAYRIGHKTVRYKEIEVKQWLEDLLNGADRVDSGE